MDARTLSEAMGGSLSLARYKELLPAYEKMLRIIGADTVRKCAMVAAQLGHESVGLKYQEEIADGSAYEWRADLGNTQPGDGRRFKGHGWIQITGRHNHTAVSKWAHQRGIVPVADYFVRNPKALGSDQYCWIGPAWYLTAARPGFMAMAERGDLEGCTRAINGGLNGLSDRRARYNRALTLGTRLLPGGAVAKIEKRLDYPRAIVKQDTSYWCGPATGQMLMAARTGKVVPESTLASEMGTTINGTNGVGQIARVLNQRMPGAGWTVVDMPNDPPSKAQKDLLWEHLTQSIDAGVGIAANIWAPVNNYPRASYTSTQNLRYSGGFVRHYVALMGYAVDSNGTRHVWWADSGFAPFGSWVTFDQTASLIPPRSYAYAHGIVAAHKAKTTTIDWTPHAMNLLKEIWTQLRGPGGKGWLQLGKNAKGQNLSLVDGVAACRADIAALTKKIDDLKEGLK
ncbi:C39 family peptidase [Corynebacterium ulceribovis]|uniref:C39 family peptidase n=1 Tax=Corynebacterium ulceribovis TaxID=487732 RepID=UPI00035E47F7|nr:C39 family peptidase [Corynebacterium ulceribovis]